MLERDGILTLRTVIDPKVWHNYGFDRHVLANAPFEIDARGFAGDTMHMARLWDSSRDKSAGGGRGYGLEALSEDLLGARKAPMKELFGRGKPMKDGREGATLILPPIDAIQHDTRPDPKHGGASGLSVRDHTCLRGRPVAAVTS